ncbi:MAG: Ig-like domain-containing protein [Deltaproteobacteria bacterium]|nr:Ig-like domain-containing protein [Deltaproteobacteria bacterium]
MACANRGAKARSSASWFWGPPMSVVRVASTMLLLASLACAKSVSVSERSETHLSIASSVQTVGTRDEVTLVLRDADGAPKPHAPVELKPIGSTSILGLDAAITDASGLLSFGITRRAAGVGGVQVRDGERQWEVRARFDPGAFSFEHSSFTLPPRGPDGTQAVLVARDEFDNVLPALPVSLHFSSDATVDAPALTDSDGSLVGILHASTVGRRTLFLEVAGQTHQYSFEFISAIDSTFSSLVPDGFPVLADGRAAGTLTLTAIDEHGVPVVGRLVQFFSQDDQVSFAAPASPTDADGAARTSVTSTHSGVHLVSAQVDGISFNSSVEFLQVPSVERSTFSLTPERAVADGVSPIVLTVILRDSDGAVITSFAPKTCARPSTISARASLGSAGPSYPRSRIRASRGSRT